MILTTTHTKMIVYGSHPASREARPFQEGSPSGRGLCSGMPKSCGSEKFFFCKLGVLFPRGSRYLLIQELELQDHYYYSFWDLIP